MITAASSQVIGRWADAGSHDELFLGGLLQDIGILALNEAIPQIYGRLIASAKEDHARLATLEQQEFGGDHEEIGAWLLERWNLPTNLRLATASSHSAKCDTIDLPIFCRWVALAGQIAAIWTQSDAAAATALAQPTCYSQSTPQTLRLMAFLKFVQCVAMEFSFAKRRAACGR